MAKKSCPRCGSTKIVEYEFSFKCLNCNSEFKTNYEDEIEDEDMLTIQEMKGILNELGLNQDKARAKGLKKVLEDNNGSKNSI